MKAADTQKAGFYLPSLDALRFFAFFSVFLMHSSFNRLSDYGFTQSFFDPVYIGFHSALGCGVSVFYCLSAFLITTLLLRERRETGSVSILRFYARRILRIWPVYFLALLVATVGIPLLHHQPYERQWLRAFATFTGNLHIGAYDLPPFSVAVLWSVCVEEQFYLLWPLVVRLLDRQWLERFAWAMVLAAPLYRAYIALDGVVEWDIWFKSLTHLDCFGAGALLALHWNPRNVQRFHSRRWTLITAGVFMIVVQEAFAPFAGITDIALNPLQGASYSGVAAGAALIVGGVALCNAPKFVPILWGGGLSYGLYSYHGIVFDLTAVMLSIYPWWAGFSARFVIVCLVAIASYCFMEKPVLQFKKRLQVVPSGAGG